MIMIEIHTLGIYQTPSDYLSHLVRQISQETPWITNHFPRLVTYQNNLFNMLEISIANFHWIRTDLTKFWWNLTKTVKLDCRKEKEWKLLRHFPKGGGVSPVINFCQIFFQILLEFSHGSWLYLNKTLDLVKLKPQKHLT